MSMRPSSGFSLIEVLIALVIIAIGLLGIAGMQALALSNTNQARLRSLAAIEAASMAAAMRGNKAYWGAGVAPSNLTVQGSAGASATYADTTLAGGLSSTSTDCSASTCSASVMAAYDAQNWGRDLAVILPSGRGTIACSTTVGVPVTCSVIVSWTEKRLQTQGGTATATPALTYTLMVQP